MEQKAVLVGNSDGIGLASTRRLLDERWNIVGVSRSESSIQHESYQHYVTDVTDAGYTDLLTKLTSTGAPDLCIYFAGIGELLDLSDMKDETHIIDVNLMGMVRTASVVLPAMVGRGSGHFIGLSSLADELLSAEAPSYHASKAGFSNYLGGLAIAARPKGVHVSNVRFGFVDTKMAKGDVRPLMMTVESSVDHIQKVMKHKPTVYTVPKLAIPLVKFRRLMMKLGAKVPSTAR